jgi:hypothetical protein
MFRSPLEIEALGRYRMTEVASESRRCALADLATAGTPGPWTYLRRQLGLGLIQIGKTIAGLETLPKFPAPRVWPEPSRR